MKTLKEALAKFNVTKKELKELKKFAKDELAKSADYVALGEDIKGLKDRKKAIEEAFWLDHEEDLLKLAELKEESKADKETLSNVALIMYVTGQTVEVVDDRNNRYVPNFSVKMVKDGTPADFEEVTE